MLISLIAWMAKNRTIGKDNKLPWHYPEDLQYFKKTTSWFPIIMWLKTYYSIGRPLPNRRNIVLSSQEIQIEWVKIFHSIPELLETVKDEKEIFVIWWASIYKQFLPLADKVYLTEIKKEYDWDTFFPEFEKDFSEISREKHDDLDFVVYQRNK
jgi:dihydrofolate reductase